MPHYKQYKTTDLTQIVGFVRAYPFANIVKNDPNQDIPSIVSAPIIHAAEEGQMEFHIAKSNPAFDNFYAGGHVVAIFNGPNAHISPSWYLDRFKEGDRSKTAPTWNYTQVKIEGEIQPMSDDMLAAHLDRLVTHFEDTVPEGWAFNEISPDILEKWSQFIQGFTLSVQNAEGLFKLSQEQSPIDQRNVIKELNERDKGYDKNLANFMSKSLE